MTQAVLHDLDGSCAEYKTAFILPGVKEKLEENRAQHILNGYNSNQAGPGWRALLEQEKYPSARDVWMRLVNIAVILKAEKEPWYISLYDPRFLTLGKPEEVVWETIYAIRDEILENTLPIMPSIRVFVTPGHRKPEGEMYWAAYADWRLTRQSDMTVVGDREEDRGPASFHDFPYEWADAYFGRK